MRPTSVNVSNVLGYNYYYDGNYMEHTERVNYAQNIYDPTLDRSYNYDQVGALQFARSGAEARATFGINGQQWGQKDGPYSHQYDYDQFGNMTYRHGWGGEVQGGSPYGGDTTLNYNYSTNKNQRDGFTYDLAGNLTNDGAQNYSYDATGQQASANSSGYSLEQSYDGDGLRASKVENGTTTYYLRSSVLGGQVIAELDGSGGWSRGYVYGVGGLMSVQDGGQLYWVHEDSVTKSKRITDVYGGVVSTVELDPWGANTNRSNNSAFMPQSFTSYIRDSNGGQDAMARRYSVGGRFSQPDPYGGSYDFDDPQSLNRYAYTKNDPVNFRDPTGLMCQVIWEGAIYYIALCDHAGDGWGGYAGNGDGKGGGGRGGHEAGHTQPQNPAPGTNSSTLTGTVTEFPCTFNVNLTSNGLTVGELQAAKGEIQEIFGASNLGVVFGSARANGGSVSLNIGTNFSPAGQRLVNSSGGGTPNGISTLGRAYVSITNTVTLFGQVQATTSAIRALSVGRVAAHEIVHGLGKQTEGSGLMRAAFGSELFDPNADSQFRLTTSDAARLARRCRGRRR